MAKTPGNQAETRRLTKPGGPISTKGPRQEAPDSCCCVLSFLCTCHWLTFLVAMCMHDLLSFLPLLLKGWPWDRSMDLSFQLIRQSLVTAQMPQISLSIPDPWQFGWALKFEKHCLELESRIYPCQSYLRITQLLSLRCLLGSRCSISMWLNF